MEKLELEKIANNIRKETISMIHNAKSGHPGGALSATDIFTYLYFNEMNVDLRMKRILTETDSFYQRDIQFLHFMQY